MSYDVTLYADTGGKPVEVWWRNHTSNTAKMWTAAGCDIAHFHGQPAWKLGVYARRALAELQNDPERFRQYEPGNGWGTVESVTDFLLGIAEAADAYPKTEVDVFR